MPSQTYVSKIKDLTNHNYDTSINWDEFIEINNEVEEEEFIENNNEVGNQEIIEWIIEVDNLANSSLNEIIDDTVDIEYLYYKINSTDEFSIQTFYNINENMNHIIEILREVLEEKRSTNYIDIIVECFENRLAEVNLDREVGVEEFIGKFKEALEEELNK